jgi:hypothetical protein
MMPSGTPGGATVKNKAAACVDVCDYTTVGGIQGPMTCGPFYIPYQNAESTSFRIITNTTNCAFDTVSIIPWHSSVAPVTNDIVATLAIFDDDGTGGTCGGAQCVSYVAPFALAGWVYVTSNGAVVGGASCPSFKLRMMQGDSEWVLH